jgi:hypothetical protein
LVHPDGKPLFWLHMMRHFYVAHQRTGGIPDREVMLLVGHKSERVMQEVYDYPLQRSDAGARAVDRLAGDLALARVGNGEGGNLPPRMVPPLRPPLTLPPPELRRFGRQTEVREARSLEAQVIEQHEAGAESFAAIGRTVGVAAATARRWLEQAGYDTSCYYEDHAETRKRVLELYRQKKPRTVIMQETGCSDVSITRYVAAAGLTPRQTPIPVATRRRAIEMYDAGLPITTIAAETGVTPPSLYFWLHQRGTPLRRKAYRSRRNTTAT